MLDLFTASQLPVSEAKLQADQSCLQACAAIQVFGGAAGALAAMTVLSALMGWAAPSLVGYSELADSYQLPFN